MADKPPGILTAYRKAHQQLQEQVHAERNVILYDANAINYTALRQIMAQRKEAERQLEALEDELLALENRTQASSRR
ncbi:MAG: hypothetical protein M5U01_42975 [Ardenticatenaceae bacterium]|nr:hypothetical protein [Ardenticatenaceae bacterium]